MTTCLRASSQKIKIKIFSFSSRMSLRTFCKPLRGPDIVRALFLQLNFVMRPKVKEGLPCSTPSSSTNRFIFSFLPGLTWRLAHDGRTDGQEGNESSLKIYKAVSLFFFPPSSIWVLPRASHVGVPSPSGLAGSLSLSQYIFH